MPPGLPTGPATLVGREGDIAALRHAVRDGARLVTLVGPAGTGKTSLAIAVAERLATDYADGAWYVPLETVRDPSLVLPTIARALEVAVSVDQDALEALTTGLDERSILVVLDNLEQVLDSGPEIGRLVAGCPGIVVLVTSRAPLRLYAEREYVVRPLALPPAGEGPASEGGGTDASTESDLMRYAAVELFVERARAVQPSFRLTESNAAAVTELCRQLDGIPLAIELAAARTKVLTPPEILERLRDEHGRGSLDLLTGGSRDRPERQQTLRAALTWSAALLPETAQTLLRRLAVFSGGWQIDAAETVCADDAVPAARVLDLLTELVDQSLVVADVAGAQNRFRLLETIREFGVEQLADAGETESVVARHIAYFVDLAEAARPELVSSEQTVWLTKLEIEHDNLRAAIDRSIRYGHPESSLRLVAALSRFWEGRGDLTEGRVWADRALAAAPDAPPLLRAHALLGLGQLATRQTDYVVARPALEEAATLMRAHDDQHGLATTLNSLGNVVRNQGDLTTARSLYAESLEIQRRLGERRDIAIVTNNLAVTAWAEGDLAAAEGLLEETLAMQRARGDERGSAMALVNLGVIKKELGDLEAARALLIECLPLFRSTGDRFGVSMALREQGVLAMVQGDPERARPLIEESLEIGREIADPRSIGSALLTLGRVDHALGRSGSAHQNLVQALYVWRDAGVRRSVIETLDTIALLTADRGFPARAGLLWGAVDRMREESGIPRLPAERADHDAATASAVSALGDERFDAVLAEGRQLDLDGVLVLASSVGSELTVDDASSSSVQRAGATPTSSGAPAVRLTPREREVLALVANGSTNKQIADALVVSPATVHQHVINIYQKLGVHNRAQATAYAFQHGLASLPRQR